MLRHVRLFGVLVFILGFTGSAWGQNFSNVVVFRRQPKRLRQLSVKPARHCLRVAASPPIPIRSGPRSWRKPSARRA